MLKVGLAIVLLALTGIASVFFGLVGFISMLVVSVIASAWLSRKEKEETEKQRHEEMLQAIKESNQAE